MYKLFKKWNLFEIIWLASSIIIAIAVSIITKDTLFGLTVVITGIVAAILNSKGKRLTFVFAIYNTVGYSYVCFKSGLYGNTIFQLVLFLPLLIMGFVKWKKHINDEENIVKMKKLTIKNLIILTIICILVVLTLGYILSLIPSQELPYIDAFTNIFNLVAIILATLRYREQWYFFSTLDIISIVMWTIRLISGSTAAAGMLVLFIAYMINCIYGMINWSRRAKLNND